MSTQHSPTTGRYRDRYAPRGLADYLLLTPTFFVDFLLCFLLLLKVFRQFSNETPIGVNARLDGDRFDFFKNLLKCLLAHNSSITEGYPGWRFPRRGNHTGYPPDEKTHRLLFFFVFLIVLRESAEVVDREPVGVHVRPLRNLAE